MNSISLVFLLVFLGYLFNFTLTNPVNNKLHNVSVADCPNCTDILDYLENVKEDEFVLSEHKNEESIYPDDDYYYDFYDE